MEKKILMAANIKIASSNRDEDNMVTIYIFNIKKKATSYFWIQFINNKVLQNKIDTNELNKKQLIIELNKRLKITNKIISQSDNNNNDINDENNNFDEGIGWVTINESSIYS